MKVIIFKVQNENYGIDINRIQAIEHNMQIRSVPNAPKYIKGLVHLRGEIIPVYNIHYKFGYQDNAANDNKLLIARVHNSVVGIEVDEVKEIQEFDSQDVHEVPEILNGTETSYMQTIARLNNDLVIIINPDTLFTKQELTQIELAVKSGQDNVTAV